MTVRDESPAPRAEDDKETGAEEDFEDKPMTFWEHLDELRKRVVWSVITFFLACFAAWEIREWMLGLLVKPFAASWKAQHLAGNPSLHFGAPAAGPGAVDQR